MASPCGPKGVDSQAEHHHSSQYDRFQNNFPASKGASQSNGKRQSNGKDEEKEVIKRVFLVVIVKRAQGYKGNENEENVKNKAWGGGDKEVSDGANKDDDGGDGDGEEQLKC